MECEILQGIDTRRIYDRVRLEWRNPVATPATLPAEKEELCDWVNRLFREDMPSFNIIKQYHKSLVQRRASSNTTVSMWEYD